MKILIAFLLMVSTAIAGGTNWGNIVTLDTADKLPTYYNNTFDPTLKQLQGWGWRKMTVEQPAAGMIVLTRAVQPVDGTNCLYAITAQRTQAEQDAINESNRLARIAWDKAMIANTIDSDPLEYGIGFYLLKVMVATGQATNVATAKQLVLDKAYTKVNTNGP